MNSLKSLLFFSAVAGICYGASVPKESRGDCPEICPQIFSPVCASDGKELRTFSNDCELVAFNCWNTKDFQLLKAGLCEDEESVAFTSLKRTFEKKCKACPRIYLPVCGVDGQEMKMFTNQCEMEYFNCEESRDFQTLKDGLC